ncbi:MAG: HEPN domain-containing protein [Terriglobia bacterium]
MPASRPPTGSPQDWLARAKGDLALAGTQLPAGAFYEDLCFHAQQAAEKALKAIYQYRGWTFRYVHDLEELLAGLRKAGLNPSPKVDQAKLLTGYAFEARYPGPGEPIGEDEYKRALESAKAVVDWAVSVVEGHST